MTDVQAQARAWLDAKDAVICQKHRARQPLIDCARRIASVEIRVRGKLTPQQRRLRERWAGCEDCKHAEAATRLLEEMKMKEG